MIFNAWARAALRPPAISGNVASVSSPRYQALQNALHIDWLVEAPEGVNAFLQPLGDREIEGLDDAASIRLRRRLAAE